MPGDQERSGSCLVHLANVSHVVSRQEEREIAHTQNFLTGRRLVERLVERAAIGPDDVVLEIGGPGDHHEALARRAARVIAVEKDAALAGRLARRFADDPTVRIVAADFLDVPLPRPPFTVFASLPFNATSEIVGRLLAAACPPEAMHLVVQREAAERYARPRESMVAVLLKPWFEPAIVHRFERRDFRAGAAGGRGDAAPAQARLAAGGSWRCSPLPRLRELRLPAWRPSLVSALEGLVGRARQAGCPGGRAAAGRTAEPGPVRALAVSLPGAERAWTGGCSGRG